ncbi:MAG: radical SAM protein [Candidatus Nitrohelix vancouverensis]|uniref:Radical SAM protein n=1 Tax=Candidatus Nitrohelix vancouverensis TaxID=2705534 RepID=A0A7T0C2W8_9BACT|nr:MAG: radical SAM protein [Candidatus Nitrohelix vancouverensis]
MDQETIYQVLKREIRDRKIPLSLGKTCPVKCTFCYEKDHSYYRKTFDIPLTTQEHWRFILDEIKKMPTRSQESWVIGGNEYMEWTDLFLHPRCMEWIEEFLETTDKNIIMFTVGYVEPKRINRLAEKYPGRINFELSVITLGKYRKQLMPNGPTAEQVLKIIDGPAVTSANFYSFGPQTMSADAKAISKINQKCLLWMGCLTPLKTLDEETTRVTRIGRQHLPDEARRIYESDLPNIQMIHTESYITAFLNRKKIAKTLDSCELEKSDSVVMAGNVYRVLSMMRPNRARYLYVPNATLGGDSDCSTLLTFNDVAARLSNQKRVYLPKVIMEGSSNEEKDISGNYFEDFAARFPRIQFKVLKKVNSTLSNRKLYEKGYLRNYVEDYLGNPLSKKFESIRLPN